jgi:Cu/Ag efflux protein CusF
MRAKLSILATALLLACALPLLANDRPHEGKITSIDFDQRMMVVQGEDGDQWMLYWTETTKLKNELTVSELKPGDSVHFDFVERTDKKFLTELRRTHKAKD